MNYPIWYLPDVGGGLIIAFIAILHVVVSHFAVGGGLWLVLVEAKAYRENKAFVLRYVKAHAFFFMLLTLVVGGLTGVGIWITISLVSPDATSHLIHTFVFAWAVEWVFFTIEIITAFLYTYTFDKISRRTHLLVGWIYFIAAWLSLLVINAILSYMITPGRWLSSQKFWHGIANPSLLPSLLFRTFLAFALAGCYALITATRKYAGAEKAELVRYNSRWLLLSLAGMIPTAAWFLLTLPEPARQSLVASSQLLHGPFLILLASSAIFTLLTLILTVWKPAKLKVIGSFSLLFAFCILFGAFEFIREGARKPFIINRFMYPSGLRTADIRNWQQAPILERARWARTKQVTRDNRLDGGEELFRLQCYSCHTLGLKNNFLKATGGWSREKTMNMLERLPGISPFMPPYIGSDEEREALAFWIHARSSSKTKPVSPAGEISPVTGEQVFHNHCAVCHEPSGIDGILDRFSPRATLEEVLKVLDQLPAISEEMPAFGGTLAEKSALAQFLLERIKTRSRQEP